MKTLRIFIAIMIMGCFALSSANAQAIVVKDANWYWGPYVSVDSHIVATPEGDINIWIEWEFEIGDWMVPEKGVATHLVWAVIYIAGELYEIPGYLKVRADGSGKVLFHWPPED